MKILFGSGLWLSKSGSSVTGITGLENLILTVGSFDGLHLGHQMILERLMEKAKELNGHSGVLTFFPHPKCVLKKETKVKESYLNQDLKVGENRNLINIKPLMPAVLPPPMLMTLREKAEILAESGIEALFLVHFTEKFSNLSALDFVKNYLVGRLNIKALLVGPNHGFGKNREGDLLTLQRLGKELGFEVEVIPPLEIDAQMVSSSYIRNLIYQGEVELAHKYMSRPYSLTGKIIHGDSRGHNLGFPTANLKLKANRKLIPKNGVYHCQVEFNGLTRDALVNIGCRPTFYPEDESLQRVYRTAQDEYCQIVEAHILDCQHDLYGWIMKVKFLHFIRNEKRFANVEDLRSQIQKDIALARQKWILN